MNNISLKTKIISVIVAVGAILIVIFARGFYSLDANSSPEATANPENAQEIAGDIKVTATKPGPLEGSVLLFQQPIEISFSENLESRGEVKVSFDPPVSYDVYLSNDKRTAIISPQKPYELGMSYTLKIDPLTKFEGGKTLGRDLIYHFSTIKHQGD